MSAAVFSLKLEDVEAHVEVDTGSAWNKPFVDVWVSYQPVIAFDVTADGQVECSLPTAWRTRIRKCSCSEIPARRSLLRQKRRSSVVRGTVTFQQHSYRMLGFISYPDGSIRQIDGQSADPAQASASGQLEVAASGGVQIQVGELDVVGVGISIDGGIKGTAVEPWPPQVCLSVTPFLQGSLFAYLNVWVTEWKLQAFQIELDLAVLTACIGSGWHVAWQAKDGNLHAVTCPTVADCFAVGELSGRGYVFWTTDGGKTWAATTITAHTFFYGVACSDALHCVVGGAGSKVVVTSNGEGRPGSEVGLPYYASPLVTIGSITYLPGGICYVTAYMTNYSGELVYGSTNSGLTWHFDTVVDDEPEAMTCLSSSSCLAGGTIQTYEGILFRRPARPHADGGRRRIRAESREHSRSDKRLLHEPVTLLWDRIRRAPGHDRLRQDLDGRVRRRRGALGSRSPTSAACVTGGGTHRTGHSTSPRRVDGGHSWAKTTISAFPSAEETLTTSLTCPSLGHCMATEVGNGLTAIAVS